MQKLNVVRCIVSIVALAACLLFLFLVFRMTARRPVFPSWTYFFYLFFFGFIWVYSRVTWFRKSLLRTTSLALPRILLLSVVFVVIVFYYSFKPMAASMDLYVRYAPVMGILVVAYFLIFEVCLFGEAFLGAVGRVLRLWNSS